MFNIAMKKLVQRKGWILDLIVLGSFIIIALAIFNARWCGQTPVLQMSSDAGDVLSYAAALDHPEHFTNDVSFSDRSHLNFYQMIHINLIRLLNRLTGDYGLAYLVFFAPLIFLQTFGFYILGNLLFKSRYWGLLLALTCYGFYYIPGLWTYWGMFSGPQTRYLFQSLLPFFLIAACLLREKPKWWPVLMVSGGLLTSLHPPAGPVWSFAVWLGLLVVAPKVWGWRKRVTYLLLLGCIYLVSALPFVMPWLSKGSNAVVSLDYNLIVSIAKKRLGVEFFDTWAAVKVFFGQWKGWLFLYWLGGALGFLFMLWRRSKSSDNVLMAVAWVLGIIASAILFPWAHKSLAQSQRVLPVEIDFIRSIRFLIPLMFVFCLWPLAYWSQVLREGGRAFWPARIALALAGIVFITLTLYNFPSFLGTAGNGIKYLVQGRESCSGRFASQSRLTEVLDAVKRSVPPGGKMFSNSTHLQVMCRHYCLRPLVWAKKDMGIKYYNANGAALPEWERIRNQMYASLGQKDAFSKQDGIVALARGLGAQYLLVDWKWRVKDAAKRSTGAQLLWEKNGYSLVKLAGKPNE